MERINIVGIGCAGKSTLARALAARLGVPHVELDALFWVVIGRWARRTTERLRSRGEFWPGTGNRETVANLFRNGLLLWILRQYRGKRRRMTARLAARPDLTVIHLRTPAEADAWLSSVP
jgi:hypothetical protein